jgi:hypothetical protein
MVLNLEERHLLELCQQQVPVTLNHLNYVINTEGIEEYEYMNNQKIKYTILPSFCTGSLCFKEMRVYSYKNIKQYKQCVL